MLKKQFFILLAFILCCGPRLLDAATKLRVFLPSQNLIEKAGFLTAFKKNYYAEQKLDVEFVDANQEDPLTALDYGLADIVQESLPIALTKSKKTPSYTLYAQLYQIPTTNIACIKPGVTNLEELKGKNIGYTSSKLLINTKIWFGFLGFQMEGGTAPYKFERFDDLAEAFSRGKLSCGIMERHQVPLITAKTTSQFTFFTPSFEQGGVLSEGLYVNDKAILAPEFKAKVDLFLKISEQGWKCVFENKEEFYMQILEEKAKDNIPLEVALRMLALIEENFDLKQQPILGVIPKNKINYTILNMLQSPFYSGLTDEPHSNFLLK